MSFLHHRLKIGDVLPPAHSRGVLGRRIQPVWHVLVVPPMREAEARAYLRAHGVHACYPVETIQRNRKGKVIEIERTSLPRLVLAKFRREPQWDVLKARKIITGVYSYGGMPAPVRGAATGAAGGQGRAGHRVASWRASFPLQAGRRHTARIRTWSQRIARQRAKIGGVGMTPEKRELQQKWEDGFHAGIELAVKVLMANHEELAKAKGRDPQAYESTASMTARDLRKLIPAREAR